MKALNIAYFFSVSSDYLGGADHTLFMQALLMGSRHNVIAVLPCDKAGKVNEKLRRKCEISGLEYRGFAYDAAIAIRSVNLVDYKRDIEKIEHFVTQERIDILHSVQINPVVEYISRKYGIPHVMNIYSLEEWEWRVPCPDVFPRYVSCDSEFYLNKWMKYLNCRGKCVRVYDEIGIQKQRSGEKFPVVIGGAGLICEYKNQLEIIKAVELVVKKGRKIRLILAGEDDLPYAAGCRAYMQRHQLQDWVQLVGFIDNMKEFFGEIDVFICGSRRESFPASVVEAVSCNIPVISTPVAGIPEILTDGENAYLSRGYSAGELAEAIERFLDDSETGKVSSILTGEQRTYEACFSAGAVREQLQGLYDEMLERAAEDKRMWNMAGCEREILRLVRQMERAGSDQEDIRLTYDRLLYLYQIKENIAGKQCYIWGAGRWGRLTRLIFKYWIEDLEIMAFVDQNRSNSIDGISVIGKEEMEIRENVAVLISFVKGQQEAVAYLEDKNMEIMENIFIIA